MVHSKRFFGTISYMLRLFKIFSFFMAFIFLCILIIIYQEIINFIFFKFPYYYRILINTTKQKFFYITVFYLSNLRKNLKFKILCDKDVSNNNEFIFSKNSVLISNHQTYLDWIFLWFLSFKSNLSANVCFVLKDLSRLPIFGQGIKNFKFITLRRNWNKDKSVLFDRLKILEKESQGIFTVKKKTKVNHFLRYFNLISKLFAFNSKINNKKIPYHIIFFPEGTIISESTLKKSHDYSNSINQNIFKSTLHPKTRGIYVLLCQLKKSLNTIYDTTIFFTNVKGESVENVYTFKNFFCNQDGVSVIHFYIRSWKLENIPANFNLKNDKKIDESDLLVFEQWLLGIWREKDHLLAIFNKNNNFSDVESFLKKTKKRDISKCLSVDFKINNYLIFFYLIVILSLVFLICKIIFRLTLFYIFS